MNIRKYQFGGFSKYYNLDNKNTRKAVNEGTKKFANAGLNVLGMAGDLFSSLFTGTPTTTTNPKTISPEMALLLKQSILKGMTWLSPLNYGTAIATGHGLNAKKGEEQVAKWDPRLQLIGRLGELYAGPKAIRGVSKGVKKGIVANEFRRTVNKGIRTSPQKTSWSSYQDFRLNGFNGLQLIERSWLDKELETGDPNTMVHYDFGDHKSSFRKNNGAYIKNNKLIPGLSSKEQANYIWWSEKGPWQHAQWMFVNPELKTPTRYISTPKTKLFLKVNEHPEKVIGLNQVAPETIMDNEFVTENPVDLSNASIILKDPLGWWSRVKYTGKTSDKLYRAMNPNKYNRLPILIRDDLGVWEVEYPDYVKGRIAKIRKQLEDSNSKVKGHDYESMPGSIIDLYILKLGFHPFYVLNPGSNLRALLAETIRRLNNIAGQDVVRNRLMNLDGKAPYYLGYFDKSGVAGTHSMKSVINLIEPNPKTNMGLDMMHEGISHGTDNYMPLNVINNYQSFVDKVMSHPDINPEKTSYKYKGLWTEPIPPDTDKWFEFRATLSEIRKAMYDHIAKLKGIKVNESTIESLRPEFEKLVDAISLDLAAETLRKTNPYGRVYGTLGPTVNPSFLSEFKYLLKYAPAAGTPLIFRYNEKE